MALTQTLASLGLSIPAVPGPFGAYIPAKRSGNLVFVAGQLPMKEGKLLAIGQVPGRCPVDAFQASSARTGATGVCQSSVPWKT